ncbi:D-glucuronyl C5-epimerase family protein [Salinibacter sp.]|uniref:D-glucuronyl C5-epimerase family protein n=1 Tax=Salinibacter sp. TaxID=2065818 RepID=UPI0021E6E588|nr:D-glucuronyl C5-epimerase family protein [Salinibacter sp.]
MNYFVKVLALSLILSLATTTYVESFQLELLMPLRNLIVLGNTNKNVNDRIPKTRYRGKVRYNPVIISQTVRNESVNILTQKKLLNKNHDIIDVADFLLKKSTTEKRKDGPVAIWEYNFDYDRYDLPSGWRSGMAQGFVAETLAAAYEITKDTAYLSKARSAVRAFATPITSGGTAVPLEKGLWFEEYAHQKVDPPLVLNGHIFAMQSLWYTKRYVNASNELFRLGQMALKNRLHRYDMGMWSWYDLDGTVASKKYHKIHIRQLMRLYKWTGNEKFRDYSKKFRRYLYLPFTAAFRVYYRPNEMLIVTIGINTIIYVILISGLVRVCRNG